HSAVRSTTMRLAVDVPRYRATLGRVDRSRTWIGGRGLGTEIGPGLQIIERINDAAANLAVLRPRSIGAMLLKRTAGETEKSRSLGRAQEARWQAGERIRHDEFPRGRLTCCRLAAAGRRPQWSSDSVEADDENGMPGFDTPCDRALSVSPM